MDTLLTDTHSGWTQLTLNRTDQRNALDTKLLAAVAAALRQLAADDGCRAVVLTGAGGHFAAGADLDEIAVKTSAEGARDPRIALWATVRAFPKPLIAAVDGFALGGGFELALLADLLVAGDSARVGLPETNLGLIPGAGGGQRLLARVGPARAARMTLLGEIIDADTAHGWGIASHRAPEAMPEAARLAGVLAGRAPLALRAMKAALVAGAEGALAFGPERAGFEQLLDSDDKTAGITALRTRTTPVFSGT